MKTGAEYTQTLITDYVFALRADNFLLRLVYADKRHCTIKQSYNLRTLVKIETIRFLRARNSEGYHVYGRPDATQYILVDDLDLDKLAAMHKDGICTRCVVQTSPGNFQAWVKVSREAITFDEARTCSKLLAQRYETDKGVATRMHFGRLPGLTNRKDDYIDETGRYPFTALYQPAMRAVPHNVVNTEILDQAREMLSSVSSFTPEGMCGHYPDLHDLQSDLPHHEAIALYQEAKDWLFERFGRDHFFKPGGEIDRSRVDHAIVKHFALGGMDQSDIIAVLMAGSEKAQERGIEYVYVTVGNACGADDLSSCG